MWRIQEKLICDNNDYYVLYSITKQPLDWQYLYQLVRYYENVYTRARNTDIILNSLTPLKIWNIVKNETVFHAKYWDWKKIIIDYDLEIFKLNINKKEWMKSLEHLDNDWIDNKKTDL